MATIKLDTMLDEVNSRLGNVVYSEWKGIKYVRKYVKAKDANSETQAEIRSTFARTVALWKLIPDPLRSGWESHTRNRPMTGYNLFVKSNFDAVRGDGMLEISRGNGLTAPWNLSASVSTNGEISVNFEMDQAAGNASVFIHSPEAADRRGMLVARVDAASAGIPVVISGFNPGTKYYAYAVATEKNLNESALFSESVSCEVREG